MARHFENVENKTPHSHSCLAFSALAGSPEAGLPADQGRVPSDALLRG